MNMTRNKHLVLASGRFQFDTLVRCDSPKGSRTEHKITVFCDDKEEARAAARVVAEQCGYSNCSVDKIVQRGNWQH
jgi:hypothetical protein